MPWTADDAPSHTKKASSPRLKRMWADVANSALQRGADDASAIRQANAAVARGGATNRKKRLAKKGSS